MISMVLISTEAIWLKSSAECGSSCLTHLSQPVRQSLWRRVWPEALRGTRAKCTLFVRHYSPLFNSAHSVCRIFSSVTISAKRRQYRNCRSLHPLPYSADDCFASDSTIFREDIRYCWRKLQAFEVVTICDHLVFFISIKLEHKVAWKTIYISFDGLIQCFGSHTIQCCQISINHYFLTSYEKNLFFD